MLLSPITLAVGLLLSPVEPPAVPAAPDSQVSAAVRPLSCLIVGGGPDPDNNGATIEAHVRYVASIVPPGTSTRILFADGDPKTPSVLERQPRRRGGQPLTIGQWLGDPLGLAAYTGPTPTAMAALGSVLQERRDVDIG